MKWYDFFANFYDNSLEKIYHESRVHAINALDVQDGQKILEIACGTGANLKHLLAKGKKIEYFGTDFSEGMLAKNRQRIKSDNNTSITLFRADARDLSPSTISNYTGKDLKFDRIICALGLSVIPDWEKVLNNLLALLNENGKIVIMDVWAEKRTMNSWLVEKIAKADLDRKIWQNLEAKTGNFNLEYMPVKESKVGGKLFVASGIRR